MDLHAGRRLDATEIRLLLEEARARTVGLSAWATRGAAVRGTFRNWGHPVRCQISSGFRCVRDL